MLHSWDYSSNPGGGKVEGKKCEGGRENRVMEGIFLPAILASPDLLMKLFTSPSHYSLLV